MNLQTMDHKLTCLLHDQAGKRAWLDKLAVFVARDLPFVFVALPLMVLPYQAYERTSPLSVELLLLFVGYVLVMVFVSQVAAYWAQKLIGRRRPFQSEHLRPIYQARISSPSFPSGHATLVAVVLWLVWTAPPLSWVFWSTVVMGLLILFARVYGGLHYVSDIIAGLIFGSVVFWVLLYVVMFLRNLLV